MSTDQDPLVETSPVVSPKLWRNHNYQLLMSGRTLAIIGGNMTGLAMMLISYDLTHDAGSAAFVMAFSMIGQLLIGLPAGAYVDRWDRKKTMVISALLNGLVIATVPVAMWTHTLTIAQLAIVCFLSGALASFYGPAEQASVKRIVSKEQLGTAMTVNQSRSAIGSVVGPPLAGMLYGLGHVWPFLGEVIGELAAALCALFVRGDLNPSEDERPERKKIWQEIVDGVGFVFTHRVLAPVAYVACLLNFGFNAVFVALVLNLRATGTSAEQIGLMEMYAGIAAIVGAVVVAGLLLKALPVGKLSLMTFVLTVTLTFIALWWHGYWAVVVLIVLLSLVLPAANAGMMGYFTAIVPDHLQGRAGAALGVLSMGLMPLAQMMSGYLLQHVGIRAALIVGLVPLAIATCAALGLKSLRTIPKASEFGELIPDES
ncbi:MAG: MFS transporter [Propionibacteriaceae bacterium]